MLHLCCSVCNPSGSLCISQSAIICLLAAVCCLCIYKLHTYVLKGWQVHLELQSWLFVSCYSHVTLIVVWCVACLDACPEHPSNQTYLLYFNYRGMWAPDWHPGCVLQTMKRLRIKGCSPWNSRAEIVNRSLNAWDTTRGQRNLGTRTCVHLGEKCTDMCVCVYVCALV